MQDEIKVKVNHIWTIEQVNDTQVLVMYLKGDYDLFNIDEVRSWHLPAELICSMTEHLETQETEALISALSV